MRNRHYFWQLAFITIIFWIIAGAIILSAIREAMDVQAEDSQSAMAKNYVKAAFPIICRGGNSESRTDFEMPAQKKDVFINMFDHIFPEISAIDDFEDSSEIASAGTDDEGETANRISVNEKINEADSSDDSRIIPKTVVSAAKPAKTDIDMTKPLIIIYHTHATESYRPVEEGNFHSVAENGTVREVGNVLAEALKAKKIKVIHNKTMHDYPSYNQSYIRSLQTIKSEISRSPSAKIVIDLHRDAADGKKNNKVNINGKKAATFSIVVGTKNENAKELTVFANYIMKKANEKYPGIMSGIINKPYKFNEYVSDYYILLEIGNNENEIGEARLTAQYFAEILSEVIKDIKK